MRVSTATRGSADIDVAAQIWAEATAARDGDQEVAGLSESRPVIEAVLARSPESFVLIAYPDAAAAGAGFAAVEPAGEGRALVSYLGVRPGSWGRGVGELLLREAATRLAGAGYRSAELYVYVDNVRAVALYERLGWRPCGAPAPHPRTGKPEQRYEVEL
ncbi:MAG TPA: GNAT family N-acetyltransferase [Streptosporangiaceae bacterium]|nr:GNAT family N-acetyltransferase [Streptosporangiaceae bacterium]